MKKNVSLLLGSLAVILAVIIIVLIPLMYLPGKAADTSTNNTPTGAVTLGDTNPTTTTTTTTNTVTSSGPSYNASSWQDCSDKYVNQDLDACLKYVAVKTRDSEVCKRIDHAGVRAECFEQA